MNKVISSLLFTLFLVLSAYGQKGKIIFSPEYKFQKGKTVEGLLHSASDGHYMYFKDERGYREGRGYFYLAKYDNKFEEVFEKKFRVKEKETYGKEIKYFKGKFAWLKYRRDFKKNFFEYSLTPIDFKGKESKAKSIARFKYKTLPKAPNVSWKLSRDTSKILFIAEQDKNKKKENYQVYLSLIDNDFNKVWQKKINMPFSQKRMDVLSWELSNDGKIYFIAKIYEDNKAKESKAKKGKGKKGKKPAYDIVIYTIDQNMDKPKKYELKLKDAFVKGVKLQIDESDDLACVGFFGDSRFGPSQGVFYLKLSAADGSTIFANKKRFSPKELAAFGDRNTSKDRKSKDSGLDATFKFEEIVVLENGEMYATAEENYYYVVQNYDRYASSSTTYYVSNSIVVINIAADGIVKSVGIIPKRQTIRDTPVFGSYATLRTKDNVYFMYNDDKDNLRKDIVDPDKIKRISSVKDFVAVLSTLDEDNELNREALFSKTDTKTLLMPGKSQQISENQLFFFTTKAQFLGKTRFRMGLLTLD